MKIEQHLSKEEPLRFQLFEKAEVKEFWRHKRKKLVLWNENGINILRDVNIQTYKEFDPGSGRTLAARLTHASRTEIFESLLLDILVADG